MCRLCSAAQIINVPVEGGCSVCLRRGGAYPKGTGSTNCSFFAGCRWRCSALFSMLRPGIGRTESSAPTGGCRYRFPFIWPLMVIAVWRALREAPLRSDLTLLPFNRPWRWAGPGLGGAEPRPYAWLALPCAIHPGGAVGVALVAGHIGPALRRKSRRVPFIRAWRRAHGKMNCAKGA